MVSEVGFSSDIDRLDFVNGTKGLFSKNSSLSLVAGQAISLFASVDPARVKNIGEYLILQLENIQFADQLYVAYSQNDVEAMKGIIAKIAAAPASSLRNLILESLFSTMMEDGNLEIVFFMKEVCPEFAVLDADTIYWQIEDCIYEGNEDLALFLLENLEEGVDFTSEAEELLEWELSDSCKREAMPRLVAALEAIVEG